MVTNPINKAALYQAGFAYPGHTEFLAALTGAAGQQIMMLASPPLRVVPVTVHASLRDSIAMLTTEMIVAAARTTAAALRRDFGIASPRLAIAGLNPHAGEQGALGDEETTLIQPAIDALRAEGIDVSGPWPPDTMFTAGGARALRRGDLHVSRPGADPAEDAGHGPRRERDAGPADRAHLARPRHRVTTSPARASPIRPA